MSTNQTNGGEGFATVLQRSAAVVQMQANNAIEGIKPDAQDASLQLAYAAGRITLAGMLQAAHAHATRYMGKRRPFDPQSHLVH